MFKNFIILDLVALKCVVISVDKDVLMFKITSIYPILIFLFYALILLFCYL